MSLAAGIVARVKGHRDNGPATRASALAQRCAGNRRRARQQRRTVVDLAQAPRLAHLLEVVEELRRLVVGTRARPARLWPCRQNFHKFSSTRGLAMDCRKSAARWAWRFELVVVLTLKGGQWRGHSSQGDERVEQATLIAVAAGGASRGPATSKLKWVPVGRPRVICTAGTTVAARTRLRAASPRRSIALG